MCCCHIMHKMHHSQQSTTFLSNLCMFLKARYLAYLINVDLQCYAHHARKILKQFDNFCLVETKKGNHDHMKAADTYYSIYPYIYIASYKNVLLEKKTGTVTNTYTRALHGKRHDLTWLTFFRTFSKFCHFIILYFRCKNCD